MSDEFLANLRATEEFRVEQLLTLAQLIGGLAAVLVAKGVIPAADMKHLFATLRSITKQDHHGIITVAKDTEAILRGTGRWPRRPANDR